LLPDALRAIALLAVEHIMAPRRGVGVMGWGGGGFCRVGLFLWIHAFTFLVHYEV